jgi:hypothetical protein
VALALHEHPHRPDGILYRARHDDAFFVAICDRVGSVLSVRQTEPSSKTVLGEPVACPLWEVPVMSAVELR